MKTLMFVVVFLLIGAFFIISNENLKMNEKPNVSAFFKMYGSWMTGLLKNSGQLAGYVVKMDWLPKEQHA